MVHAGVIILVDRGQFNMSHEVSSRAGKCIDIISISRYESYILLDLGYCNVIIWQTHAGRITGNSNGSLLKQ